MTFVDKSFVGNRLDSPPYGFDILVVVGNIGVVHIYPITYSVAHSFPFALVFPNGLFTFFDKRLDTVFFYFGFSVNTE